MNTIEKLIAAGRDPLEAVLFPPAPDVAEWIEQDKIARTDAAINNELSRWPDEWRARLRQLIEERAQRLSQEQQP